MDTALKRTFLAALPLAGLLIFPPLVSAHEDETPHQRFHDRLNDAHENYHDRLNDLHRRYHQQTYSYYGRHDRGKHRGWYRGKHRGWYGNPQYYDNSNYQRGSQYCPPRYYGKSSSNQYPWWR